MSVNHGFEPRRLAQPSKVELVLEEVRRGILEGSLRAGEPLSISELSTKFGISPGPLREALRRLDGEGLIHLRPSRSAVVAAVSVDDLRQIYRLRISLEGDLVALAAKVYTSDQLERLERLLDDLVYTGAARERLTEAHDELHRLLLAPVASEWDWRVLDTLWLASGRYLTLLFEQLFEQLGEMAMVDSHRPLVDAAKRGNARELRRRLTEHLEEGVERLARTLGERDG